MKQFMRATTTNNIFKLKSVNVTNHDEIWQELYDFYEGKTVSLKVTGEFFLKLGIVILQKLYPSKPEEMLEQDSLLSEIIVKLYDYYTDKPNMVKRIFHFFMSVNQLTDIPANTANRKIFYAHFLKKGINLSIDDINKRTNIANKEISMGEYTDEAVDGLFDDVRSEQKIKQDSIQKEKPKIDITQQYDNTSPQEEQVLLDEEVDEAISRAPDRKLSGQRIQSTISEIMDRRKWREKQLVGFYGQLADVSKKRTGQHLIDNPHLFISGMLFPTSDGLLFCSNCANAGQMDYLFQKWLKDEFVEQLSAEDAESNIKAAEGVRKRPN
ncbi:MAG: hypothetical protein PQJ61_14540 [Spirochaetales bacterium]|uniref:Uncharacterized protein n=1 Tax=Candidatus Thalassospirochaeta sargassi TaxID=3119039 RepID=A0AAJ1IEV7_9SPIO|nr:hypothetical protein [Spirochaetales bacterium]